MKKMLFFAAMMLMAVAVNAQVFDSSHRNHIAIDLTLGGYAGGDIDGGDLVMELGVRDTYDFNEYFSVDALKISARSCTEYFGDFLDIQAKTGVRGYTPVMFGQSRMYGNAAIGYGIFTEPGDGGFAWEVGAGLDITRHFAVGFAYNSLKVCGLNFASMGGRLSYTF